MTSQKLRFNDVTYQALYREINRLRKRDGLEDIGGLHFALKLHDHVLLETNSRVKEALDNLRTHSKDRISKGDLSSQL
jgi:hypothetical protein